MKWKTSVDNIISSYMIKAYVYTVMNIHIHTHEHARETMNFHANTLTKDTETAIATPNAKLHESVRGRGKVRAILRLDK